MTDRTVEEVARGPKVKPVHRAKHINDNGDVSPLCAPKPRKINLRRATWTLQDKFVTCAKCKAMLTAQKEIED